jgi:hypothetical protein
MTESSDWDRYVAEVTADPIWDQYPEAVPTVSTRTRVVVVLISVVFWSILMAGIWAGLAA